MTSTRPVPQSEIQRPIATLRALLSQRRDAILKGWQDRILRGYPNEAAAFFGKRGDRFANPVGHAIVSQTESVLAALLEGSSADEIAPHLGEIIKQRAIQEMRPSEAVGLVFDLRDTIREALQSTLPLDANVEQELRDLEDDFCRLVLHAFDAYCGCRETIYQIRMNELKRNVATLLRKAAIRSDGEEASRP